VVAEQVLVCYCGKYKLLLGFKFYYYSALLRARAFEKRTNIKGGSCFKRHQLPKANKALQLTTESATRFLRVNFYQVQCAIEGNTLIFSVSSELVVMFVIECP
jgi:hypothetical protein